MNRYVGDFTAGKTVRLVFNSNKSDGTPVTLAGTPVVSVYKDSSTTESTAGVTLTVDFDSRTGLHQAVIDTSADGTFYAAGSDFRAVLTAGTVDSISVVGVVVGGFSLANRAALRPTVADHTLDVSATGEAGVDWANVGTPTTTVNLSGTTVSTTQAVASVAGTVGSVTGNVGGSVASVAAGVTLAVGQHVIVDSGTVTNVTGAVGSVNGGMAGDVGGKVLGGGSSTITGIGTRAVDTNGNALLTVSGYTPPDNTTIGRLGTGLQSDGGAGFQWTVLALANAPAGGGGGGGATAAQVWDYANRSLTDKAGFNLGPTGLDAVATTAPTGPATTFPGMLVQIWRRYLKKTAKTVVGGVGTIKTYADDGVTVYTNQPITDDGNGNQTLGSA